MNRTPIASPLLLVGRDATETWHGSDDEYREVGIARQFQDQMNAGKCMATCAFLGTNPADEPITSGLPSPGKN
jgi:hypothetical protein